MKQASRSELLALHHQLARLLDRADAAGAEALAARARAASPQDVELARLHGLALLQLGRADEARAALEAAAELAPDSVEVQCNLAGVELEQGDAEGAIARLRAALRKQPGHAAILLALGNALMAVGRYAQARESYAMATHGAPQHAGLRLNLAAAELELGNLDQAAQHTDEGLQLAPDYDGAYAMRARVLHAMGRVDEAAEAWLQAERCAPEQALYPFHAGLLLDDAGNLPAAAEAFERALRLDAAAGAALAMLVFAKRRLCDWRGLDELSERLHRAVAEGRDGVMPFAFLAEEASAAEQRRCAATFAAGVEKIAAPWRNVLAFEPAQRTAIDPLRVGFVSNGFGERPIGQLLTGVLEKLGDERLQVHVFCLVPDDGGPIRQRLAASTTVHDVTGLAPMEVARRVHAAGIEVLFDLRSYGGGANSDLFEFRPAPVQVNWLAYPATAGAAWTDYLLTDAVALPAPLREGFSEKIVRLSRCALPFDDRTPIAAPPSRADCGLPESGTVFASFNGHHKLNPASFARFMLILQQVPDSVLWLYSGNDGTDQRLRQAAGLMEVDPDRLVFMPRLPHAEHLARLAHADLFLDTLPCNAQSTAADALWAGCPVLTWIGRTLAGRQGASLLFHAGLPELVADDEDSFVSMAVHLGKDREALDTLRRHLQDARADSPVFDTAGFANDLRRAIQAMGARHRIGRPPADLDL
ncbi:putative O-linked N-acetylglucosamine transferase (SPINDLY family) [Dyella sp. SG562]|uniref:O-linked N-acetylglucosamine transferase, SPINDLY family protein n=1 Tax=Dyella sp. SG562 TaxID=2587017 RepID=UPI00142137C8|nr:tetratricopeptide repeat protein [Dyella sp. SG562]NII74420.1 putative O-linked N-acetylglucosamine transferase (SPINDLY family) [Dyella sp. SG562]